MTFKRKTHASYSQRNEFWQDVDMDKYFADSDYREKVEYAWDQHRYLYNNEARIDAQRTDRED